MALSCAMRSEGWNTNGMYTNFFVVGGDDDDQGL